MCSILIVKQCESYLFILLFTKIEIFDEKKQINNICTRTDPNSNEDEVIRKKNKDNMMLK